MVHQCVVSPPVCRGVTRRHLAQLVQLVHAWDQLGRALDQMARALDQRGQTLNRKKEKVLIDDFETRKIGMNVMYPKVSPLGALDPRAYP